MPAINLGNFLASYGGGSGKDFYLDANYSTAQPTGLPVPTYPFLNQGDTETVIFRQPYEQALASYTPPDLTSLFPGVANAYPLGDVNFRDGQGGVVTFERTFGNIPRRRIRRGQSHRYAFQFLTTNGAKVTTGDEPGSIEDYEGPTYSIGTRPETVDSTLIMDYFITGEEGAFPLLEAPQFIQVGQNIQHVGKAIDGGAFPLFWNDSCACAVEGQDILAESDVYSDWEGAIQCRVRRIIKGPTLEFWKSTST